jgi:hypothetical protein
MEKLEQDILKAIQGSIGESIKSCLVDYNSPLNKLVESVVNSHTSELRDTIEYSFSKVIMSAEFKETVNNAFNHKLARILVDKLEGAIEKRVHELRSDPTIKAKMILAIEGIIKAEQK